MWRRPWALMVVLLWTGALGAEEAIDVGSRRELLIDDALVERISGEASLRLQHPEKRNVAVLHDAAWEGTTAGYHTVFRDGDLFRMYYIAGQAISADGSKFTGLPFHIGYAESRDGKTWTKPNLGLYDFQGSKENNIVWEAPGLDNFHAMRDDNPDCRAGEEYKAVTSGPGGLFALKSSDGIHWSRLRDEPIIRKGAFDTHNVTFWDSQRKHYWAYIRDFHNGVRDIRVAESSDYLTWSEPAPLEFNDLPDEPLYTNSVVPYWRAPHIFVGFPTRYSERPNSPILAQLPDWEHRQNRMRIHPRIGTAITDGLFMTSRDGRHFHRWGEVFYKPGIERVHNWLYGDYYQNQGLIETASDDPDSPAEMSMYVLEDYWKRPTRLRRVVLRLDGFVALHAPLAGGELVTKPIRFSGKQLSLNYSTSGAGSILVELLDAEQKPIPGFTLDDCYELFGDTLDRNVIWKSGTDLGSLERTTIRLRFVLRDADLYSWKFEETDD